MTSASDAPREAIPIPGVENQHVEEGFGAWRTRARRFALIALLALLFEECLGSLLFILRGQWVDLQNYPLIEIGTVLTHWIMPCLIVWMVERRSLRSLGWDVPKRKWGGYVLAAFVLMLLPGFFLGIDRALLMEFIEQVVYIGLAEEVFFRGYLLERLKNWLGGRNALLLSAIIFSLVHIVSRLSQGVTNPMVLLQLAVQTLLGGFLLGFIYLRAGDIVPGSLFHIAMNLYLPRVFR